MEAAANALDAQRVFYVCSAANDGQGRLVELFYTRTGEREVFLENHDRPGRSVYDCINPLQPGSSKRRLGTVAAITVLAVDIDLRQLADATESDVRETLLSIELPIEVRYSGGGYHVIVLLKEEAPASDQDMWARYRRAQTALMKLLGGDPAPNHPAALLRAVGTHNTKYGDSRKVAVIRQGEAVDITEVEAFCESQRQLFERIPTESVDRETGEVISFLPALDVESTLANMPTTGAGVNDAQPRLARAMFIQQAAYPGDVESAITDATMAMAERERLADRDGKPWTRATEEDIVRKRIRSVLARLQDEHFAGPVGDTPPGWLWPEAHAAWIEACKGGARPNISRNPSGYYVRRTPHSKLNGGNTETLGDNTEILCKPDKSRLPRLEFVTKFNVADLPPGTGFTGDTSSAASPAARSRLAAAVNPPSCWWRQSPWRRAVTYWASSQRRGFVSCTITAKTRARRSCAGSAPYVSTT